MNSKLDKNHLIISEFGLQKRISSQKDLIKNIDQAFKDLGLTKNDIILISSKDLENKTNLIIPQKEQNDNIKEIKDNYYLFSMNNKYEIYKQEFENKLKYKIENNSFISTKDLFGDRISINCDNDLILSDNNQYINNIQMQKNIEYIQECYTNFKSNSIIIDSNISLINTLMNKNISNINKSINILYNYYKNRIKNIQNKFENLKENLEEVNKRVTSFDQKIKSFIILKKSINNKEELDLFKLLMNENKINQNKEKINKSLLSLKEKIKNKSQKFDDLLNSTKLNDINLEKKLKNVIDSKKLEELNNKIKNLKESFNATKNNGHKNKFENEIQKIKDKFKKKDNLDIKNRIDKLDEYKNEDEINILINNIKNLRNTSENVLNKITNFITDYIIKKYFRFSSDIFLALDSFESFNTKFISYINLLENIGKDNFDLLFSLDEALRFRFYFNEYERRINFLKDLKIIVYKIKKSLIKENEIRLKFNEELKKYFIEKVNDNKFGIQNNIISFFEWEDIKGSFDIYGDKYYINIKINEEDLNYINPKYNLSSKITKEKIFNSNDIFSENYSQQEMIYNLNKKVIEYKMEINKLNQDIENKNEEFKQLKSDFNKVNNLFNNISKNNQTKKNISNKDDNTFHIEANNDGIKKENNIFNPLYDEITDDINEEESFAIKDNDSISSAEDNKINNDNYNNQEVYLTLEQCFIIKKTFFNYFANLLSLKNEEYNKLFSLYNSLKMSLEDKLL